MAKRERMRLSDVYARPGPFTGPQTTFAAAYPTIEDIRVEIDIDGKRPYGTGGGVRVLDKTSISECYDCPNPQCTQGGIRLGSLIAQMVYAGETAKQVEKKCEGFEGSPKGKKFYGTCDNWFKVTISIRYKEQEQSSEQH